MANRSNVHRRAKAGYLAAIKARVERDSLAADPSPENVARLLWSAAGIYEHLPPHAQEAVDAEIDRRRLELDVERAERGEVFYQRMKKREQRHNRRMKCAAS